VALHVVSQPPSVALGQVARKKRFKVLYKDPNVSIISKEEVPCLSF
jgi:hypothetical protein